MHSENIHYVQTFQIMIEMFGMKEHSIYGKIELVSFVVLAKMSMTGMIH
jgi:hypothetical protein